MKTEEGSRNVRDIEFNDMKELEYIRNLEQTQQYIAIICWIKKKISKLDNLSSIEAQHDLSLCYAFISIISQCAFNNPMPEAECDYFDLFNNFFKQLYKGQFSIKTKNVIQTKDIKKWLNDIKELIVKYECSVALKEQNTKTLINNIYDHVANILFLPDNNSFYKFSLVQNKKINCNKFIAASEIGVFFLFEIIFRNCRNKAKTHKIITTNLEDQYNLPEFQMYFILKYLISYLDYWVSAYETNKWTKFIKKWPNIQSSFNANSSSIALFDKTKNKFLTFQEAIAFVTKNRLTWLQLFQGTVQFADSKTNEFMHYELKTYTETLNKVKK